MTLFGILWHAYTTTSDGRSVFASWLGLAHILAFIILAPFALLFIATMLSALTNGSLAQSLSVIFLLIIFFAPIFPKRKRVLK